MRVQHFPLILALVAVGNAQYFSDGWKPGQTAEAAPTAVPEHHPSGERARTASFSLFSLHTVLAWEPVAKVFDKFGIHVTDGDAMKRLWHDERIPMITDSNYAELIENEPLTEEEESLRVWALVVTASSHGNDEVSKAVDPVFNSAFNLSQAAGDLPHVRWGRIDYYNVTWLTTKWNVWRAPWIVIVTDRGQSLRFYVPHHVRLQADALREFLLSEGWKNTPPWTSIWSPGGDLGYVLDFLGGALANIYVFFQWLPNWIVVICSGTVASLVMSCLHGRDTGAAERKALREGPAKADEKGARKKLN